MNWKPKPGKVYPALLLKHKDDSFGIEIFPTTRDRERAITRIIDGQVRESFPALPTGDCPVPVRAKVVGPGKVAVELLTPDGEEWHEIMVATQRRPNDDDGLCTLCSHVEYHDPVTGETLCLALHDGGDGNGGECECGVENDGEDRVFVENEDGSWDEVASQEEAVRDWCEWLADVE